MFVYWLLFGVFAIGALFSAQTRGTLKTQKTKLSIAGLLLVLIVGFRYDVGPDWEVYQYLFEWVGRVDFTSVLSLGDYGFYTLLWLVQQADLEIWTANLIYALVFAAGLIAFANRQPNPWLAVAVAVPYLVVVVAMSATRQATAIGFLFLALVAFSNRKLWQFGFLVLCASLFHTSAVLMLVIGALSYTRNRFQSILIVLVAAVPAYFLLSMNVETYIARYSDDQVQSTGALVRVIMNFIPAVLYLLLMRRFPAQPHEKILWRNLSWIAIACLPLLYLVPSSTVIDRLSVYAIPLQIYVLSRLPALISSDSRVSIQYSAAIIGYSAFVLFGFMTFGAHAQYYIPYQSYLI